MQAVHPKNGKGMTLAACLWTGLFPLLQGGTYRQITHDKWVAMLVLTAFTLCCFFFDSFPRGASASAASRPSRAFSLPLVLASLLLFWTVLSCLLSPFGPSVWFIGADARREGLASQLCYFLLFFLFAFSQVSLVPVLLSSSAGIAAYSVVVFLQRAGGNPLGLYPPGTGFALNPEFQGPIGNVDMVTGYLCLMAGLLLYGGLRLVSPPRPRPSLPVLLSVAAGFGLAVGLILSMGVQFGAVTLGVLFLAVAFRFVPRRFRLPLLILLVAAVLLAVWFWPGTGGGVWELHEILRGRGRLSFGSNRVAVWLFSLRMAGDRLLTGGGSATFPARFRQYLAMHSLSVPTEQDGVPLPALFDNPHSVYIAWLTDHGLPAALLFAALLLAVLFRRRDGWLPLPGPFSAAVLCYAVQGFFSFSVCLVAPVFWVLLGLAVPDASEASP